MMPIVHFKMIELLGSLLPYARLRNFFLSARWLQKSSQDIAEICGALYCEEDRERMKLESFILSV
jgi:hypothetical protein